MPEKRALGQRAHLVSQFQRVQTTLGQLHVLEQNIMVIKACDREVHHLRPDGKRRMRKELRTQDDLQSHVPRDILPPLLSLKVSRTMSSSTTVWVPSLNHTNLWRTVHLDHNMVMDGGDC